MFEITRAWVKDPFKVGAIAASSPRLARALAREAVRGSPEVVLEVGAGSGAVTRALRDALPEGARLVATDVNLGLLRLADVPGYRVRANAAFPPVRRADVIVSSIPFGSMPEVETRRILNALSELAPRIVLYQYTERRLRIVREYFPGARIVDTVLVNLPPAQVVASPLTARA